jgi:hypothetical protein
LHLIILALQDIRQDRPTSSETRRPPAYAWMRSRLEGPARISNDTSVGGHEMR